MAKDARQRLDRRMAADGLAESPQMAAALIMEGKVLVGGRPAKSAGEQVCDDVAVTLKSSDEWVSRGAYKLLTAARRFALDLRGRVCLDVGSSTGGFTQVMLSLGAETVYAVDVGYGLLDWRLRRDPRVRVMERTNARFLVPEMFAPLPDFAASDASFISLRTLLGPMARVTAEGADAVVLVKPQFEARREDVGEGGVVRSAAVHAAVLEELLDFIGAQTPWGAVAAAWSDVKGPKGNIEYLLRLCKGAASAAIDVRRLVDQSHEALD